LDVFSASLLQDLDIQGFIGNELLLTGVLFLELLEALRLARFISP
jgi:hypothetical protein